MKSYIKPSFLKFILSGIIAIAAGNALASAPLCSSVFAETKIIHAVEDLAQMRMKLDLAKSHGPTSPAITLLAKKYPEKYKELLQLTHSEELLKKLVHEKIQELQGLKKDDLEEETAKRAQEQAEVIDTRKFKMRVPITFDPPFYTNATMEYAPQANSVIAQTKKGNTVVIDLKTSALSYPLGISAVQTRTQLSPSGKEIVILSPTHISIYDLIQKKMKSHQPLLGPALKIHTQQGLAWNPLQTKIAFIDSEGFAILDVVTGRSEIVLTQEEMHMNGSFFINDHEVAITQDVGQETLIYNLQTKEVRTFINSDVNIFRNFQLASDGSPVVIAVNNRAVHILDKNTLQTIRSVSGLQSATFFENDGALIMEKSLPDAEILDFKNPEKGWIRVEEFSKFYSEEAPGAIDAMTITNGNILVRAREKTGEFIDIWSIE